MKRTLPLIALLLCLAGNALAQNPSNDSTKQDVKGSSNGYTEQSEKDPCKGCTEPLPPNDPIKGWDILFAILTPLVPIGFIIFTLVHLKGFSLKDALSSDQPIVQRNKRTGDIEPYIDPNTQLPVYPRSTSRLILFVSGVAAISLSIAIASFFIYYYIKTNRVPEVNSIVWVLLSLGIGVVPYSITKLKKNTSTLPKTDQTQEETDK